ncbi:Mediator complex [Macleaya cordata]|uniref:Mediator of RNA polymerase II transcription subunit 13 n=1 Tax=Macleaya cordata TaxID=56857 RepID=A0A200Q7A7_MACCD|nr:Mediator complex [Macleaya cordata]
MILFTKYNQLGIDIAQVLVPTIFLLNFKETSLHKGGLHHISWFQFLPFESDLSPLPEKGVKGEQKDAATLLVLSSHLQLQKEGFLSTWTNSFVGPWDPSQGMHNPDEKIKLWLFLPGRHSSVVEAAQAAVSKLRVVGSGFWLSPGDSEEVAAALSQALRNCVERALRGMSYLRYGDVFARCHPFSQSEITFRRVHPTVEFVFAATEEAIFVHVIISAKHIRTLSGHDLERVVKRRSSSKYGERLPVIVAPHGMRGRLTGCCPSDLVKQVYFSSSKVRALNGFTVLGIPLHVAQASGNQLRGQSCYVEVTLGCRGNGAEKGDQKQGSGDHFRVLERTFIYPAEAVLVPVIRTASARSSLKRFWLQNWVGTPLFGSTFSMYCSGFEGAGRIESVDGSRTESNGIYSQQSYDSSSDSNSSSISSISSTSSDSDYRMTSTVGDLEADADSLTCRQSGLSSNDQFENDGYKQVSKRPRLGMTESFGGAGTVINATTEAYKSDFCSVEVNNSVNDLFGSLWDWEDDDRGGGVDIHILLSDFGDFGDLFENDALPFGEPPGTAESQALIFSVPDCGEVIGSPCTGGMDVTDQMLLPVLGFSPFESLNPAPPAVTEEFPSKTQDFTKDSRFSDPGSYYSAPPTGEFEHLSKAEAIMTFAPEYRAVETAASELSSSIFSSPYLPRSRKVESSHSSSNAYIYGAVPPSPCLNVPDEKPGIVNAKAGSGRHDANPILHSKKYYTHIESWKHQHDKRLLACNNSNASCEGVTPPSFSGFNSTTPVNSVERKKADGTVEAGHFLLSLKTTLATEVECIMFQASMCRTRHMLLSSCNLGPTGLNRLTGSNVSDQLRGDQNTTPDKISSKYEVKKKESIPVRIAGDIDGGMLDGPVSAPVGVWRSVGVPKGAKTTSSPSIDNTSFAHNAFNEEGMVTYGQRQPLQELLDGMTLLVQQATSFVDVALDADYGDGPYGWLALQEQCRRGFSCGPSTVHAGCGGLLATGHSLDIAGVELLDPISANVHASSVISLLQSDIKVALKSAFGNLDGPLTVTDWCKGRSQSGDAVTISDGYSVDSTVGEAKDSSSSVTLAGGEPISPSQSSGGSSCLKVSSAMDGTRVDEASQRRLNQEICNSESEQQMSSSRLRPTLVVLPLPAILVGYQDDWLKTSTSSLQLWEKAPLEPYALPKPMTYYVLCPDIGLLTSAAADFFQQLGTVYETCKLGTHSPQNMGQTEVVSGKWSSSGFVLIDCPESMKIESGSTPFMGSISDYLLALSNNWDLKSFLKSLSNVIKALRVGSNSTMQQKEGSSGPTTVIYVVCPFPEPLAVLQTLVESSTALGSIVLSSDKERRSLLRTQVGKALSCSAAVDEASISNVLTLSGFSIPKLVLQIVTVEAILRVTSPALNELVLLKEIAFTVYNKARRIARSPYNDTSQSSGTSGRSQSTLMHISSPIQGMWKDCVTPRITGSSLSREGELDASLRWDNTWQTSRAGGLSCDPNRSGENSFQDDMRYSFEPLFILAEPGSMEQGISPTVLGNAVTESSRPSTDDNSGGFMQTSTSSGCADAGASSLLDGSEADGFGSSHPKTASLHCCYGWTEDWRWLVCIWTDSRGELLDSHIFPFGGISSRQDTKGLQCLFVQVLHQGCQILSCSSPDIGPTKPRDIVITRIGSFYELERQEWQKAIYSVGGNEVKKWPLQLRRSVPDGISASSNGSSLHQQEMSLIQERTLPSSPSPSMYSPQTKSSSFIKGGLGQTNTRKQLMGGQAAVDSSRGMFQWVQSISLVGVSIDHSLHLILQADTSFPGGTGTQGGSGTGPSNGYLEGFNPVKSIGSTSSSYVLIPSPSMRYLPPTPLQLPTCLTSESPPLAHLLHSKGSSIPLSTGFVVSKAVPSIRTDSRSTMKEEWPSILSVNLVDYYGGTNMIQEKMVRGSTKQNRNLSSDSRDHEIETHLILETLAAELHALSWMTVSPAYLDRRSALPFHCEMVLRLRRLLHFADKELSQQLDKAQV